MGSVISNCRIGARKLPSRKGIVNSVQKGFPETDVKKLYYISVANYILDPSALGSLDFSSQL